MIAKELLQHLIKTPMNNDLCTKRPGHYRPGRYITTAAVTEIRLESNSVIVHSEDTYPAGKLLKVDDTDSIEQFYNELVQSYKPIFKLEELVDALKKRARNFIVLSTSESEYAEAITTKQLIKFLLSNIGESEVIIEFEDEDFYTLELTTQFAKVIRVEEEDYECTLLQSDFYYEEIY